MYEQRGGGGVLLPDFLFLISFPCLADHERDWPPCHKKYPSRVGNRVILILYAECERQHTHRISIVLLIIKYSYIGVSELATFPHQHLPRNTLEHVINRGRCSRAAWNGLIIYMYVCMVAHVARVWINRVRLPILLVVS